MKVSTIIGANAYAVIEHDDGRRTDIRLSPKRRKETAMLYAEAAYFDGAPVAHVAAWEEHRRLQRIRAQARLVIERRTGSRARGWR